jgi:MFS transporter, NNP family, nitrate/nitrite transporter
MQPTADQRSSEVKILCMSTVAFAACFAVWTIFSIIGNGIKGELGLNETEFGLLIATPILTGSLILMPLGIWSDGFVTLAGFTCFYCLPGESPAKRFQCLSLASPRSITASTCSM